ncbi:tetratricopeptide repeat protein [Micromonospora auratinigra]|uniref:TPR repeat-containing protein n=1 Tax=Micromonospora auratinigra TaxID=261654 RepID=A0A1A8ZTV5_9ACTN|nr:tetratricopeptide repeat protein [Micromonospora auratinigra]SBT47341.1 TPR repeat-containing protein [Micromonospora auratinigra]
MTPQTTDEPDAVARAAELARAEQFAPAVALLREHLAADPADNVAWRRLAGALIGLGRHALAVEAAGRAIDLDPTDVAAHRHRALARLLLDRPEDSYADAQHAVRLAPDDPEALSLLAWSVLRVDRDPTRFRELVQQALRANPDSPPANRAVRHHRRMRRWAVASGVLLAALPGGGVPLLRWWAAGDGSTDDRSVVVLLVVTVGCLLFGVSGARAFPLLTWAQSGPAAGVAGLLAAAAGYAAVHGVPTAVAAGTAAIVVAVLFWLVLFRRRAR